MNPGYEIVFFVETGWPKGRRRTKDEEGLTGVEWTQKSFMPFVPRKGDMVCLNEHDDYRCVDDVYLSVSQKPEKGGWETEIAVHFVFEEMVINKNMLAGGWGES